MSHCARAFTLIELLIVVAIIAILAAIAVPNFLEAQVRAKVSRVKADLRTMATGFEAYAVDYNHYPDIARGAPSFAPPAFPVKGSPDYALRALPRLSTPVSYVSQSIKVDPFGSDRTPPVFLGYANLGKSIPVPDLAAIGVLSPPPAAVAAYQSHGFLFLSIGPDGHDYNLNPTADPEQGAARAFQYLTARDSGIGLNVVYDPTNGTISVGDIYRTAKGECR